MREAREQSEKARRNERSSRVARGRESTRRKGGWRFGVFQRSNGVGVAQNVAVEQRKVRDDKQRRDVKRKFKHKTQVDGGTAVAGAKVDE